MEEKKKSEKSYWQENTECAMIETRKGASRRLFTDKTNLPFLIEFARAYKADLNVVKVQKAEIWPLKLLVEKLNSPNYSQQDVEYETIKFFKVVQEQIILGPPEQKVSPADRQRILNEIYEMFLAGEVVSLAVLVNRYPAVNKSTLRHYMSRIKTALFFDGYEIEEVGRGKYATNEKSDTKIYQAETAVTVKT